MAWLCGMCNPLLHFHCASHSHSGLSWGHTDQLSAVVCTLVRQVLMMTPSEAKMAIVSIMCMSMNCGKPYTGYLGVIWQRSSIVFLLQSCCDGCFDVPNLIWKRLSISCLFLCAPDWIFVFCATSWLGWGAGLIRYDHRAQWACATNQANDHYHCTRVTMQAALTSIIGWLAMGVMGALWEWFRVALWECHSH